MKEGVINIGDTERRSLKVPKLDFDEAVKEITGFIKETTEAAKAEGVVIGLSGGVDSSLTATLCVHALGREKVLGILMPTAFTPHQDVEDALKLADWLRIRKELVDIQGLSEAFFKALHCSQDDPKQRIPTANIRARTRMVILYYYANLNKYLVAGTGNRSERLIGYFTKHGDGGVDFAPIAHLYKTQVRELAKHLGLPKGIVSKPSSPQLYPGHRATDELPLSYEKLDPILIGLFDKKLPTMEVSRLTEVPVRIVEEVLHRFNVSQHKRIYPPMVR